MAGVAAISPLLETGVIGLGNLRYPCADPVRYIPTARFGGRVTFGDASRDSDAVLSVDIMFDFSGGGQVLDRNEGSDQGRFWWATTNTRDPFSLMLNREVVTYPFAGKAAAGPLGDLTIGGTTTFWAYGDTAVFAWTESTETFGAALGSALAGAPTNLGIEFGVTGAGSTPVMWIPLGTAGYQTFDGTTVAAAVTTITPVAFCVFLDILYALGTDGVMSSWDGATWTNEGQLDKRHTPKNLILFYAADDARALCAVTNRGLWAYDETFNNFKETDLSVDPHPDNGLASANWAGGGGSVGQSSNARGDLYYAAATQVYRYVLGSTVAPIGPQRDQGLPLEYRGKILSLAGEHNGLYALMQGATSSSGAVPDAYIDPITGDPDSFSSGTDAAVSTLMVWTGVGWHTAWVSSDVSGVPSRLAVSAGGGAHRVWFGYGGSMLTLDLPTDFHLPRQGLQAGVDRFQPEGFIETGWFDAQMAGFDKLASHFQINLSRCQSGCSVVVRYQVNFEDTWTILGSGLTQRGKRILSFGFDGLPFQRIRFRVELASSRATESPLIDSMILHFTKIPHPGGAWEVTIPLDFDTELWGRSAEEMMTEIDGYLVSREFTRFTLKALDYRVRVAAAQGSIKTGELKQRALTVSLIEVVLETDEPLEDVA